MSFYLASFNLVQQEAALGRPCSNRPDTLSQFPERGLHTEQDGASVKHLARA